MKLMSSSNTNFFIVHLGIAILILSLLTESITNETIKTAPGSTIDRVKTVWILQAFSCIKTL